MEKGYFAAAWGDVKNSPGWFGKILLLGLIMCIPIFGPIVVYGYLFGWARDIAWNVHRPMPAHIFGNEDGFLYKRGGSIFVVYLIIAVAVGVIEAVLSALFGVSFAGSALTDTGIGYVFSGLSALIYVLLTIALCIVVEIATFAATMRSALYGTITAGLQIKTIWSMIKRDYKGLFRILGLEIIGTIIVGIVVCMVVLLMVLIACVGIVLIDDPSAAVGFVLLALLLCAVIAVAIIAALASSVFIETLVIRALGYWARQFDVPRWGTQDEPLPEASVVFDGPTGSAATNPPYGQPYTGASVNQGTAFAQGMQGVTQQPYGAPQGAQPASYYPSSSQYGQQPYVTAQPYVQPNPFDPSTVVTQQPAQAAPVVEYPAHETPVAEQEQSAQAASVAEQFAQGAPVAKESAQAAPVVEQAAQGDSVAEQPVHETPVTEESAQAAPIAEQPSQVAPVIEQPSSVESSACDNPVQEGAENEEVAQDANCASAPQFPFQGENTESDK